MDIDDLNRILERDGREVHTRNLMKEGNILAGLMLTLVPVVFFGAMGLAAMVTPVHRHAGGYYYYLNTAAVGKLIIILFGLIASGLVFLSAVLALHLLFLYIRGPRFEEKEKNLILQALLDEGADVNAKDSSGGTVLMLASRNGYKEVVQALLDKGADVNAENSDGGTALMDASTNGHKEIVELLLARGANVNTEDIGGETASSHASMKGHKGIVKLLSRVRDSFY
ncbi:MAG: ankyrin repeat domain-containing protein [Syntrophobacteraceae bacterium]